MSSHLRPCNFDSCCTIASMTPNWHHAQLLCICNSNPGWHTSVTNYVSTTYHWAGAQATQEDVALDPSEGLPCSRLSLRTWWYFLECSWCRCLVLTWNSVQECDWGIHTHTQSSESQHFQTFRTGKGLHGRGAWALHPASSWSAGSLGPRCSWAKWSWDVTPLDNCFAHLHPELSAVMPTTLYAIFSAPCMLPWLHHCLPDCAMSQPTSKATIQTFTMALATARKPIWSTQASPSVAPDAPTAIQISNKFQQNFKWYFKCFILNIDSICVLH